MPRPPLEEEFLPPVSDLYYEFNGLSWRRRNMLLSLPWVGCAVYRRLLESA